jgi:hypothetical protein
MIAAGKAARKFGGGFASRILVFAAAYWAIGLFKK